MPWIAVLYRPHLLPLPPPGVAEVEEPEVARKTSTDELEAELEMDLDNLKLDDIDTTDVNLDDEDLLED